MQTPESMKDLAKEFISDEIYHHDQEEQEIYWERNKNISKNLLSTTTTSSSSIKNPVSAKEVRVFQEEEEDDDDDEEEEEQERYIFWERNYKRQDSFKVLDKNDYFILEESSNGDQADQVDQQETMNLVPMHTINAKISKRMREKNKIK